MEKQLGFELKNLSSGKQINPPLKKHLSKKKGQKPKEQKQENQLISRLLPKREKELNLSLDFLSLKETKERIYSETNILKKPFPEKQNPKKELLFDNQIHLISIKTVAEMLGLAPKTIHNWVYLRKIPYVKCGQKVMFRPKSLKAWLNRKEAKSWL